jgi:hypothetical protein
MSEGMVKPPPAIAGGEELLAQVLKELGNDRPYTMIRSDGNKWRVFFEGDKKASTVKKLDGKYTIIQDN